MPLPESSEQSSFRNRRLPAFWFPLVAVVMGLAFAGALAHLLSLRFRVGDIYPAYSSLRSDPLGCRALYEALDRLDGVTAVRHFGRAGELPEGPGVTVFRLGLPLHGHWSSEPDKPGPNDAPRSDGFPDHLARTGTRLVIALNSGPPTKRELSRPEEEIPSEPPSSESPSSESPSSESTRPEDGARRPSDGEVPPVFPWGVGLVPDPVPDPVPDTADAPALSCCRAPGFTADGPEEEFPCRPGWSLEIQDPTWTPVYMRGGRPVVVQRAVDGGGTVVILAESFALSNEALARDRRPGFLAWLAGRGSRMVFDETHFGLMETPGVAALGRKYGLEGMAVGLLVLALLFVWKNGVPLVPPRPVGEDRVIRAGGKGGPPQGMVHLLRRHVPETELLAACFGEWRRLVATEREKSAMRSFSAELERHAANPVAGYHRMRYLLTPAAGHSGGTPVPPSAETS